MKKIKLIIGIVACLFLATSCTESESRKLFRSKISSEYAAKAKMSIAYLFSGENALQGNYSKRQLKKLNEALADGKLTESDDVGEIILMKARNNGDLIRMSDAGINVFVEF